MRQARPGGAKRATTWTAEPFLPAQRSLPKLREASRGCRGCPLYERAQGTVFGEGRAGAPLLLVGEMPGDAEDRTGRPFVGPARRILDRALTAAGIERKDAYVTNAVKHFKWEERGKRRLHKTPSANEVRACRPWLLAEIETIRPRVLVALGATAAKSLLGSGFRISREHGRFVTSDLAPFVTATSHPSAVLRRRTDEERHAEMRSLVADLRRVREALGEAAGAGAPSDATRVRRRARPSSRARRRPSRGSARRGGPRRYRARPD